ncbi:hypothetical protein ACQ4PT_004770 [Festuca glaucescens]
MAHKRPFDAVAPEQEAAPSPRKRLRRAVFIVMFLFVGARFVDLAGQVLVAWLGSMEERLFRELPGMLRGLSAEQLGAFPRSVMVSMEDKIRSVRQKQMLEPQPASLPNDVYEPSSSRAISEGLPEGSSGVVKLRFLDADRPEDTLFTHCPVKWQNGENAKLTGMKTKSWSRMIEHASTCAPGDEIYSYRVAEENCEVLFNDLYDLVGIVINGLYVPVKNIDKDQQRKVKNWKISAHKKFDEQENSGGLAPDYFMSNDNCPVREKPLNNEAGPSVQARPTWQQQDLGQHGPSMLDNGTAYNLGQGSFSGQPTFPSQKFLPVPKDDSIIGAGQIDQHNGNLSSSMIDAPCTSLPVTDGLSQGTSSINQVEDDFFSGLTPIQEWLESEEPMADQGFVPTTEELPNSNTQFYGYEHEGGNQ